MKNQSSLQICLAQLNPIVGDIEYNTSKVIKVLEAHRKADLIIFPEMFLVGYPLMDHIYDPLIKTKNKDAIEKIRKKSSEAAIILGTFTESKKIEDKLKKASNIPKTQQNKRDIAKKK